MQKIENWSKVETIQLCCSRVVSKQFGEKGKLHDNSFILVSLFNHCPLSLQYYNHCCKVKNEYLNIKYWLYHQKF